MRTAVLGTRPSWKAPHVAFWLRKQNVPARPSEKGSRHASCVLRCGLGFQSELLGATEPILACSRHPNLTLSKTESENHYEGQTRRNPRFGRQPGPCGSWLWDEPLPPERNQMNFLWAYQRDQDSVAQ